MNNPPLVSIVVITYNSSRFIIETLDSILNQDYKNLELIISDDCSSDNTVEIIKEWISENNDRFKRTEILEHLVNQGTSKNITDGCKVANGIWVKPIPGDDLLLPLAISNYVKFAMNNDSKIVYSYVKKLVNGKISNLSYPIKNVLLNKNCDEQYYLLINGAPFYSPTEFYSNTFLKKMNYFDSKYKLIEDFPFLLKATKSGVRIHFIENALMIYRVSEISTSNSDSRRTNFINKTYFEDLSLIYKDLLIPNLNIRNFIGILDQKIKLLRMKMTLEKNNTKEDFHNTRWLNLINPKYLLLKVKQIKDT